MEPRVYFIQAINGGPIKIGFAKNIRRRLVGLQTSHPYELVVLAHRPGSKELEAHLHVKHGRHRLIGEWFEPHTDVLAEVEAAKKFPQNNYLAPLYDYWGRRRAQEWLMYVFPVDEETAWEMTRGQGSLIRSVDHGRCINLPAMADKAMKAYLERKAAGLVP